MRSAWSPSIFETLPRERRATTPRSRALQSMNCRAWSAAATSSSDFCGSAAGAAERSSGCWPAAGAGRVGKRLQPSEGGAEADVESDACQRRRSSPAREVVPRCGGTEVVDVAAMEAAVNRGGRELWWLS